MAIFDDAVELVLANEGGFVDNPHDSGGATNFGLSLRFLRWLPSEQRAKYGLFGDLTVQHIRELTRDQAVNIYRGEFWVQPLESLTQVIANYIFDMIVNHGNAQAIKLVQRAIWAAHGWRIIPDDGVLGSQTMTYIKLTEENELYVALKAERAGFMRLIAENPQKKEFLDGWLKRCYRT